LSHSSFTSPTAFLSLRCSPPLACLCTGWRRPTGCLKLQIIFTNCRALLRKMTCKDKASYGVSPPVPLCRHLPPRHCMLRMYIYLHQYRGVCVGACLQDRKKRGIERGRERQREGERECVCTHARTRVRACACALVCVCICARKLGAIATRRCVREHVFEHVFFLRS